MLHGFLPFSLVSFTEFCSFWYSLKDLFTLHKLETMLSLTFKTGEVTSGRNNMDLQRWLGDKWVTDQLIASFQLKQTVVVLKCPVCRV